MNKTLILNSGFFAGENYYVSRLMERSEEHTSELQSQR